MKNQHILSETDKLFDIATDKLQLDKDMCKVLKSPYREVKVEIPVRGNDETLYNYCGYRIQFNGARGPYYGGLMLDPDINADILIALAARTSWKTALMNLPFGGSCGGINCDVLNTSPKVVEAAIRKYINKISALIGPYKDVITYGKSSNSTMMAYIMDEYGKKYGHSPAVSVGKPEALGGSIAKSNALISSSYYLIDMLSRNMQMQLPGLSIAISLTPARAVSFLEYLNYLGTRLVAINDCNGTIYNHSGFDINDLKQHIIQNNRISDYQHAEKLSCEQIVSIDCDLLLLGSGSVLLTSQNAKDVKAKIVCELSDALISMEADIILFEKGVTVIPDVLCTSGECIIDYFEWIQNIQQFKWDFDQINEEMAKYINENFKQVTKYAIDYSVSYRVASYMLGITRVAEATKLRGYI